MSSPKIFVINCATDQERWAQISASAAQFDLPLERVEAIDARDGIFELRAYSDMLPDSFWKSDLIKPGAFACFLSHRKVWQIMVDQQIERALICEDDVVFNAAPRIDTEADLTFVNDRMSGFAEGDAYSAEKVASALFNGTELPAVGADGYILSMAGAKALLAASSEDRCLCGVDWYMLYCALDSSDWQHSQIKACRELKLIWQVLAGRAPILSANVSATPEVHLDQEHASSIRHAVKIPIAELRS